MREVARALRVTEGETKGQGQSYLIPRLGGVKRVYSLS